MNGIQLTVIPPSSPMISETKFESNNINISWNKDVTVDHYNIQYNVTILECAGEISAMQNGNYKSSVMTVNSSFYVINGSVNRTEENSNYTISITAVNTKPIRVKSEPTITTIMTEEAGNYKLVIYVLLLLTTVVKIFQHLLEDLPQSTVSQSMQQVSLSNGRGCHVMSVMEK